MATTLPAMKRSRPMPHGFTLVELLIVITIIGVLVALLMPAIDSARESGRRAQCMNNIKQMSLGCLGHESKYNFLPTGGWGYMWCGDPDRGFNKRQPGGAVQYSPLHRSERPARHGRRQPRKVARAVRHGPGGNTDADARAGLYMSHAAQASDLSLFAFAAVQLHGD